MEALKTKVIFCTKLKRFGTFTKEKGHFRKLRQKTYRMDEFLNVAHFITIDGVKYVIQRLMFTEDTRSRTQEIWVVPYE